MNAQADLRLCWSHIPHCWKYHVSARIRLFCEMFSITYFLCLVKPDQYPPMNMLLTAMANINIKFGSNFLVRCGAYIITSNLSPSFWKTKYLLYEYVTNSYDNTKFGSNFLVRCTCRAYIITPNMSHSFCKTKYLLYKYVTNCDGKYQYQVWVKFSSQMWGLHHQF